LKTKIRYDREGVMVVEKIDSQGDMTFFGVKRDDFGSGRTCDTYIVLSKEKDYQSCLENLIEVLAHLADSKDSDMDKLIHGSWHTSYHNVVFNALCKSLHIPDRYILGHLEVNRVVTDIELYAEEKNEES